MPAALRFAHGASVPHAISSPLCPALNENLAIYSRFSYSFSASDVFEDANIKLGYTYDDVILRVLRRPSARIKKSRFCALWRA